MFWIFKVEDINKNHKNSKYHPNLNLSKQVTATMDLAEAVKDAAMVLCCLPVQVIPDVLEKNKKLFSPAVPFCSCSKGMKNSFINKSIVNN